MRFNKSQFWLLLIKLTTTTTTTRNNSCYSNDGSIYKRRMTYLILTFRSAASSSALYTSCPSLAPNLSISASEYPKSPELGFRGSATSCQYCAIMSSLFVEFPASHFSTSPSNFTKKKNKSKPPDQTQNLPPFQKGGEVTGGEDARDPPEAWHVGGN